MPIFRRPKKEGGQVRSWLIFHFWFQNSGALGLENCKSEPLDLGGVPIHRPGTLIGKALDPLKEGEGEGEGEGEILVLLSLQ